MCAFPARAPLASESDAVAVGHKEEPLSLVRGPDVSGLDEATLDPVTEPSEVTDNAVHPSRKERRNVLDDDEARAEFFDDARVLAPEAGAVAVDPGALAGVADVLARETAAEDVDGRERAAGRNPGHRSYIDMPHRLRPVAREHAPAERVKFDLPDYGTEPGHLQAAFQPADPREQRADGQGHAATAFGSQTPRVRPAGPSTQTGSAAFDHRRIRAGSHATWTSGTNSLRPSTMSAA